MGASSSRKAWWDDLDVDALPEVITKKHAAKAMGRHWSTAAEVWWQQRAAHCNGAVARADLLHELRWRRVNFAASVATAPPRGGAASLGAASLPHPWCDDEAAAAAERCTASPPSQDDAWLGVEWLFGALRATDELGEGSAAIGRAAAALVAAPGFLSLCIGADWWSLEALEAGGQAGVGAAAPCGAEAAVAAATAAVARPRVDMLAGCRDGGFAHDSLPLDVAAAAVSQPAATLAGLGDGEREWTVRDEQGFCDELLLLLERWLHVHGSLLPSAGAGAGATRHTAVEQPEQWHTAAAAAGGDVDRGYV
jgi:hypothetical protein